MLSFSFVINELRFLGKSFLVRKHWVHKTASFTRMKSSCKHSIEQKKSANKSKRENAVLNPWNSFLALKTSTLGFWGLSKDRSLQKLEKHRAHYPLARRWTVVEQPEIANQSDCFKHQVHWWIIVLVYTHEVISTESERKLLKKTISLIDGWVHA